MSLGDGIFWGAVVASMVALFLGTHDPGRWKRAVPWTVGGLLGVVVVAGAGVYGHTVWQERPPVITENGGIPLGATTSDVFLKGQRKENASEKGWFYKIDDLGVTVEFDALYVPRTRARPSAKPRTVYVMMLKINME